MSGRKKGGGGGGGGGAKAPTDTSPLFADLLRLQGSGDFDKALKVTNKILNVSPADAEAFHCKVVCLMQTQKFEDALKQMQDNEKIQVRDDGSWGNGIEKSCPLC